MDADLVYMGCVVLVGDKELLVDSILLEVSEFDVIFMMDWLASYHATMDFFTKLLLVPFWVSLHFILVGLEAPKV